MKNYKLILTVFLLGITLFSVFKFSMSMRERMQLRESLEQAGAQITAVENEKQNLMQTIEKESSDNKRLEDTNTRFKLNLRACNGKIFKLNKSLLKEQKRSEELALKANLLTAENESLKKSEQEIRNKYAQASLENEAYKAKFGSVAELKKAIRDLKRQARQAVVSIKNKFQKKQIIDGNRGYIIKDGKSTYPAKVKIEVIPVTQE